MACEIIVILNNFNAVDYAILRQQRRYSRVIGLGEERRSLVIRRAVEGDERALQIVQAAIDRDQMFLVLRKRGKIIVKHSHPLHLYNQDQVIQ